MATRNDVLMMLAVMAEQSGEQVSEARIEFVARRLEPYGLERVVETLEKMVDTHRRFPTVGEIKQAMGVSEQSNEDKGREVGELIWAAICRFGSVMSRWPEIAAAIGPIGVEVVKRQGGWMTICEIATNDNATTLKAQWRELAQVLARKPVGELDVPPDFTRLPEAAQKELALLVDKFSMPGGKR